MTRSLSQCLELEEEPQFRVNGASLAPKRKAGDYVCRLTVPANSEKSLDYEIGIRSGAD